MSSVGLAIGLLMVVGLLGLIISQGVSVFWPKDIAQLTFKTGQKPGIGDAMTLAGAIVKKRERRGHVAGEAPTEEWQLFLGNRDAGGESEGKADDASHVSSSRNRERRRRRVYLSNQ